MHGKRAGLTPEKLQLALTAKYLHDTDKYSISEVARAKAFNYYYLTFVKKVEVNKE